MKQVQVLITILTIVLTGMVFAQDSLVDYKAIAAVSDSVNAAMISCPANLDDVMTSFGEENVVCLIGERAVMTASFYREVISLAMKIEGYNLIYPWGLHGTAYSSAYVKGGLLVVTSFAIFDGSLLVITAFDTL